MVKKDKQNQDEIIQELETQITELKGKNLILLADFENFKKRVREEKTTINLIANASVFEILLEILDDLDLSIKQMEDKPEGLGIIQDKIRTALSQQGVEKFEAKSNDKFDPKTMEAIGTLSVTDPKQENLVIHMERAGYKIKDQDIILRPSRVIVGKIANSTN